MAGTLNARRRRAGADGARETSHPSTPLTPLFPAAPRTDRPLIIAIAIMMALASLTAIAARVAWGAAAAWSASLDTALTIEVAPVGGLSGPDTAAEAARLVVQIPGIANARALSADEVSAMIAPALGTTTIPPEIPLPGLIAVERAVEGGQGRGGAAGQAHATALIDAIDAALRTGGFTPQIDDHSAFERSARSFAATLRTTGVLVFLATLVAAVLVTGFAVHANMAMRRDIVEVLHIAGAHDVFIANAVTLRFSLLGAKAGAAAAVLGALGVGLFALATLQSAGQLEAFTPRYTPNWIDVMILVITPGLAAGLSALAARRAAMGFLEEVFA